MHIQILGTAAAEAWPAVFCGCNTCVRARKSGGKDFRSRASVQIDDIFKIDLPPDTYHHSFRFNVDFANLKHLFITHSHDDHFQPTTLNYLKPPFAHDLRNAPVHVYGNADVIGTLETRGDIEKLPMRLVRAEPFVPIRADHLTFTPILAHHQPNEQSLNYVIQSDSATVLYASDTGLYEQPTMDHLAGYKFTLLIIECTQGTLDMPSTWHMGLSGVLELRQRLIALGAAAIDTPTVITHFSHNMGLLHAEMEEIAAKQGITVAYDGIELDA